MQSNEINQLCPKCTDNIPHLIFKPESNLVNISCPCGNDSSLPLSDYIYEYSSNINKKCTYSTKCSEHNEPFTEVYMIGGDMNSMKAKCSKCVVQGEDVQVVPLAALSQQVKPALAQVDEKLEKLKEARNYINSLKAKNENVPGIDEAHDKVVKKIEEIISFINLIVNNCRENNLILSVNVLELTKIDIDYVKYIENPNNAGALVSYFSSFSLFCLLPSANLDDEVLDSIMLHNKNIASIGSNGGEINIFKNLKKISTLKAYKDYDERVGLLCELDNGFIVAGAENVITILKQVDEETYTKFHTIKDPHQNGLMKLVAISENRFVTFGKDHMMKIWHGDDLSETPIKELDADVYYKMSFIFIKEKNLLIGGHQNICIWDMKEYTLKKKIDIEFQGIEKISEEKAAIGSNQKVLIFNIEKEEVEDTIEGDGDDDCDNFLLLRDKKTLLGTNQSCKAYYYNIETKEYKHFEWRNREVKRLIPIDESTYVTSGYSLLVWKY